MVNLIPLTELYGLRREEGTSRDFLINSGAGVVQRVFSDLVPYRENVSSPTEGHVYESDGIEPIDSDEREPSDCELREIERRYGF